ncbi:helix-turn-helix transcriptional regulator [Achromobacter xylosoxidans]|jgi:transcriptional regulator with XRE-family HTH domain
MSIGERLRAERERLNMSQSVFADAADLARKTLYGYECGERFPDAAALAKWADAGVDILYVITGNFTASDRRPSKPSLPAEDGQAIQHCYALSTLSDSDRVLLRDFHAAPPQVQVGVQMTLGAFAPSAIEARKCESTA